AMRLALLRTANDTASYVLAEDEPTLREVGMAENRTNRPATRVGVRRARLAAVFIGGAAAMPIAFVAWRGQQTRPSAAPSPSASIAAPSESTGRERPAGPQVTDFAESLPTRQGIEPTAAPVTSDAQSTATAKPPPTSRQPAAPPQTSQKNKSDLDDLHIGTPRH